MPQKADFKFDLGEDWPVLLTCYEDAAQTTPMNLTGGQVELRIARDGQSEIVVNTGNGALIQSPATAGVVLINVAPSLQTGTVAGNYPYTVRATTAGGFIADQIFGHFKIRDTEFPAP